MSCTGTEFRSVNILKLPQVSCITAVRILEVLLLLLERQALAPLWFRCVGRFAHLFHALLSFTRSFQFTCLIKHTMEVHDDCITTSLFCGGGLKRWDSTHRISMTGSGLGIITPQPLDHQVILPISWTCKVRETEIRATCRTSLRTIRTCGYQQS